MQFSKDDVRQVAALANLHLDDEELEKMAADLSGIVTHMEQLAALDTSAVEPMAQVLYPAGPLDSLREDVVRSETVLGSAKATANSALAGSGHFKVPKVIER
jgi:aspartyl-tRNA(Asn)/glutamyl-tRNA(Gln) amidotransferase subunit C